MLRQAETSDVADIVTLMNRAFRGAGAAASWTNEAAYIDGDRTSEALIRDETAAHPGASFLVWSESGGPIDGCVLLVPGGDTWSLGSLTVDPSRQGRGLGRRLLRAAETWAAARGAQALEMTVVNIRDALIGWYIRCGYERTGEVRPFPYDDGRYGVPRRADLAFIVLRKAFATS